MIPIGQSSLPGTVQGLDMLMKTEVCCQTARDRDLDGDAGEVLSGEGSPDAQTSARAHSVRTNRTSRTQDFPVVIVNTESGHINEMIQTLG